MIKPVRSFWFGLFCVLAAQSSGQELRFHYLNQSNGLPSDWVFAIEQDQDGFMWVGTDAGLVRYDGYSTVVHRGRNEQAQSLLSNKIRSLFAHSNGQLYVGSADGGVNRYVSETQSFDVVPLEGVQAATVRSFAETDSALLIGTSKGLYRLPEGERTATLITVTAEYSVNAIAIDHYGGIWLGTSSGVFRYDMDRIGELQRIPVNHEGKQRVLALTVDQGNTLWASIDRSLYAKSAGSATMTRKLSEQLPDAYLTSLQPLTSGQLAIGTFDGLYLYDGMTETLARYAPSEQLDASLSDGEVFSLEEDRTGSLWIGTYRGGVSFVNPAMQALGLKRQHGACRLNGIKGAEVQGRTLWLARTGEVMQLREDGQCIRHSLTLADGSEPIVLGIHLDSRSEFWLRLQQNGLARFDPATGELSRSQDAALTNLTVSSWVETSDGQIWLGTESQGLIAFDPQKGTTTQVQSTSELSVYEIEPWREGLLLATNRGVLHYQPAVGSISQPFSLPPDIEVLSLSMDEPRQSLWVGTRSDGLYLAQLPSGPASKVSESTGYVGETVRVLLTDSAGATWVGSNRGIYRTPPGEVAFRELRGRDGLHGDTQYNGVYSSATHSVVFAGEEGLNQIAVSEFPINRRVGHVVVTDLSVAGRDVSGLLAGLADTDALTLEHSAKDFRFHFSLPHYDDASRNRYRYRLNGYDTEWTEVGADQRQATYTNLPAGDYELVIAGANKDRVWGPENTGFALKIQPAWWATWWARLCFLAVSLLILWRIVRYRSLKSAQYAQHLGELVEQRTNEIEAQKNTIESLLRQKNELFAAISHEFRTPLTLIEGPLQHVAKSLPDGMRNKHVHIIQYSSKRLLKLVDQLLSLAGLDREAEQTRISVRLDLTLAALVAAFTPAATRKDMTIDYSPAPGRVVVDAQPDAIETIVGNLINNALKYCPSGSCVSLKLAQEGDTVVLSVSDNGPGIPESEWDRVFDRFYRASNAVNEPGAGLGLALCKELATASGGSLTLDSTYKEGTRLLLSLSRSLESSDAMGSFDLIDLQHAEGLLGADPEAMAYPAEDDAMPDSSRDSVLVIDDDPELRTYIRDVLSDYDCQTAKNGEEGIKLALENVPDLIVCDVMMPGADGFEVAHAIRKDVRTSHIPFVLLTARVDQDSRMRGWQEHVDEYLTKPFTDVELKARLRSILEVRRIVRRRYSQQLLSGGASSEAADVSLLPKVDSVFMQRLSKSVERHYNDTDFGPEGMASDCAMSVRQLQRKLRALVDTSPADFLRDYRLKMSARLLFDGLPAGRVAEECGFSSASQFSRCFRAHFNVSPSAYQQTEQERRRQLFKQSS